MANKNTGKIIFGLSLTALVVGGYFLLKPKKAQETTPNPDEKQPDSTTSTESNKITPPPTLPSTNPTGTTATSPAPTNTASASPNAIANVYSTAKGAIVYKANIKLDGSATIGSKLRTANYGEKIGQFKGNRDISGYTFMLVKDVNSGQPVLVSKSVAKTAL